MPATIAATDPIGPVIKLGYANATIPHTSEAVASFSLETATFVSADTGEGSGGGPDASIKGGASVGCGAA
jgi:hypothetical protein